VIASPQLRAALNDSRPNVLITVHRRESFGEAVRVCSGDRRLADRIAT